VKKVGEGQEIDNQRDTVKSCSWIMVLATNINVKSNRVYSYFVPGED
jgi:hypothetical protein